MSGSLASASGFPFFFVFGASGLNFRGVRFGLDSLAHIPSGWVCSFVPIYGFRCLNVEISQMKEDPLKYSSVSFRKSGSCAPSLPLSRPIRVWVHVRVHEKCRDHRVAASATPHPSSRRSRNKKRLFVRRRDYFQGLPWTFAERRRRRPRRRDGGARLRSLRRSEESGRNKSGSHFQH